MAETARGTRPTGIAAPITSRSPRSVGVRAARLAMVAFAAALVACSAPAGPSAVGVQPIDETKLVVLAGNTHPKAIAKYDVAPLDDAFPLDHLQLVLKRSPERQAGLDAFIEQLHDPSSPNFHKWLTAAQFADSYGVPAADVATVSGWLTSHGLHVDGIGAGRMHIEFSGTAGLVGETFHTSIHRLNVFGEAHFANMTDPQIPEALASVVVGVHALHDFMPHPLHKDLGQVQRDGQSGKWGFVGGKPAFTIPDGSSTYYALGPADFATIYNLNPLFAQGYRGLGQTIAVVEDTNIENGSDVASFRSAFGLSGYKGTFTQVNPGGSEPCSSPGVTADEGEAALDAEWAGASAPDAAVELASCANTTVFGGLLAVQNLIAETTPPQIISMSYGECEVENGSAANQNYVNTYAQAVTAGVSVFVSSGDEGAASCDADKTFATHGIAVSGLASTPNNVAVGGTDFMDLYNADQAGPALSKYWSSSNTTTDAGLALSSAKSYIPEIPWNDSCASKLIYTLAGYADAGPAGKGGFCSSDAGVADFLTTSSGSGGPSTYSAQPSWQAGIPGLPTASGGKRYLPDVSLFAANGVWGHFYVYCMTDTAHGGGPCNYSSAADTLALAAGGTSFAAPAMAGIQALVNQKTGSSQGNPNLTYYKLAANQVTGNVACNSDQGAPGSPAPPSTACIFNDVTQGDMDVPCTGSTNCFGYSKSGKTTTYGALSTSSTSYGTAYPAGTGWDYATGLGSLNATNLVNSWSEVGTDGGVEAGVDAGVEAGTDSGTGADSGTAIDSGPDAASDAAVEGASDAQSQDAAADGSVDASVGPDATGGADATSGADAADSSSGGCTPTSPCSIWPLTATPAGSDATTSVELGTKLQSAVAGYVTGIRFYKDDANATHTVNLWDASGDLLARAESTNESMGGWQTVPLTEAVAVAANTTYVASYFMPGGGFALDRPGFTTAVVSAPLEALADGPSGGNGVYSYGESSSFPASSVDASNYWVDVLFSTTAPPAPTCTPMSPCSIWPLTATPAGSGATTSVELGMKLQSAVAGYVTGIRFYKDDANATHTVNLWDASGNLLARAESTNESMGGWQTVPLTEAVAVAGNTMYVASYFMPGGGFALDRPGFTTAVVSAPLEALADGLSGGNGLYSYGASSLFPANSVDASNYWVDVLFSTTAPPAPTCTPTSPCSIWPLTATPAGSDATTSVELGMKLQSAEAGYVTGIRFYKDDANATHTVNLWSASGTLLASASTASESGSGWQTATFPSAVSIAGNTTYVVSYFMPGGGFALDRPGFTTAVVSAPLEALADGLSGGNGLYSYGASSSFPASSVDASNYWVDVLFSTTAP